jgi:hypothetical protein
MAGLKTLPSATPVRGIPASALLKTPVRSANAPLRPTNAPARAGARTSTPAAEKGRTGAAATATVEPGWTLYSDEVEGFSINVAPKWKRIDVDPETIDSALSVVADQNPGFKSMLSEQVRSLTSAGVKFFAVDLAPEALGTGLATNMNVIRQTPPAKVSLDMFAEINTGVLENLDTVVGPVSHKRVNLGGTAAEKVTYGMEIKTASGKTVQMAGTQYYVLSGKDVYIITLCTSVDQAADYAPVFEKIAQSFRLPE